MRFMRYLLYALAHIWVSSYIGYLIYRLPHITAQLDSGSPRALLGFSWETSWESSGGGALVSKDYPQVLLGSVIVWIIFVILAR